jgi:hypothetical protein
VLTVIIGPPCSGKSTYVREHARPGDVVIDFDIIAQAFGSPDGHGHARMFELVTVAAWSAAVTAAISCHRRGARVWIVDTDPHKARRQRYHIAGARFVRLAAPRAELHRRADAERPELWHRRIDEWLVRHAED